MSLARGRREVVTDDSVGDIGADGETSSEPEVAQVVCGRSEVPVASGVATPRPVLDTEHDEAGNGWLASLVVAVEHVDSDAPRSVERLSHGCVQGCSGIAQGGLPEPHPTGADQEVSLLWRKRRHAWRLVPPTMSSGPLGILSDFPGGVGLKVVSAEHGDTRSEIAKRDGEVNRLGGSLDERLSGRERKDHPIRELHLGCRVLWPRGAEDWTL